MAESAPTKTREEEFAELQAEKVKLTQENTERLNEDASLLAELEENGATPEELKLAKEKLARLETPEGKVEVARERYIPSYLRVINDRSKLAKLRSSIFGSTEEDFKKLSLNSNSVETYERLKAEYDKARVELGQKLYADKKKALEEAGLSGEELERGLAQYRATEILDRTIIQERQKLIDREVKSKPEQENLFKRSVGWYRKQHWATKALISTAVATPIAFVGGTVGVGTFLGWATGRIARSIAGGQMARLSGWTLDKSFFSKGDKELAEKQKAAKEEIKVKFGKGEISQQEYEKTLDDLSRQQKSREYKKAAIKIPVGILIAGLTNYGMAHAGNHIATGVKSFEEPKGETPQQSGSNPEGQATRAGSQEPVQASDKPNPLDHKDPKIEQAKETGKGNTTTQEAPETKPTQESTQSNFVKKNPQTTPEGLKAENTTPTSSTDNLKVYNFEDNTTQTATPNASGKNYWETRDAKVTENNSPVETTVAVRPSSGANIENADYDATDDGMNLDNQNGMPTDPAPVPHYGSTTENPLINIKKVPPLPPALPDSGSASELMDPTKLPPPPTDSVEGINIPTKPQLNLTDPNNPPSPSSLPDSTTTPGLPRSMPTGLEYAKSPNLNTLNHLPESSPMRVSDIIRSHNPMNADNLNEIRHNFGRHELLTSEPPHTGIHGMSYHEWNENMDRLFQARGLKFSSFEEYEKVSAFQRIFGTSAVVPDSAPGGGQRVFGLYSESPKWGAVSVTPAQDLLHFGKTNLGHLAKDSPSEFKKLLDLGLVRNISTSATKPLYEYNFDHKELERLVHFFKKIDHDHYEPYEGETVSEYLSRINKIVHQTKDGSLWHKPGNLSAQYAEQMAKNMKHMKVETPRYTTLAQKGIYVPGQNVYPRGYATGSGPEIMSYRVPMTTGSYYDQFDEGYSRYGGYRNPNYAIGKQIGRILAGGALRRLSGYGGGY